MTHHPPSAAGQQVTIDRRAFVACAVAAVGVMGVVLVATPAENTFASSESLIIPVAQLTTATAILLVTTSAIFYQRWRAGTEGGSLALGIAVGLMAFGSLDLVGSADGWDRVGVRGAFDSMTAASRMAALVVLAIAVTAWRHAEPRLRTIGAISAVSFGGALVLVEATSFDGRTPGGVELEGLAYFSGSVLAWWMLVLGALCLRHGRIHQRVEYLWMGVLAVVVGMSSIVLHHASASTHLDFLGGVGLLTLGSALVTAGLHNDLVRIEAAQNSQFRRVALEAETGRMVLAAERNDRAIIAHDGRSALLAIEGGLRYVAANHHGDPEATEDIYRALTQEVARLRRMLSGRAIGEKKRFLVADAVAPAIRLHALEYDDIVVDTTTEAQAFGDPDATREIIQNLLDNAIQHGTGRHITLRTVEYLDSVTITVADHGPGVPESLHEAIFERGVSSKPDEASGLGLHSSRELAAKMGGELRIDPVARGASFTLTLPSTSAVANAALGQDAGGQVIDLRGGSRAMTTTPAGLLIVDDHLLLAQGLAASLAARGLPYPRIVDPTRANVLSTVVEGRPDIVLLDVDFGDNGRAGLALVEEIVGLGCRVIMFTGINDDALYGRCIELGAEAVIRKCAALDAVVDDIERAMHGATIGNDAEKFGWYRAFRTQQTRRAAELAPFETLTQRESEVLALLVDGLAAEEIAEETYVAVSTIRSHVRSIFRKLGVHSQLAAVALARRARWQLPVVAGSTVSR